jgi:zinc/manganese transport system substrate-binding protein
MKRRHLLLAAPALLALPAIRAQTRESAPDPARAPRLVASFSLLADLLREIAPPGFEVQALVGADADAHVFEPRPSDARRLAEADLVVVNGLGFEGWLDRLVRASGYRGTVVTASRDARVRRAGSAADPHAWLDVTQARRYVATMAAALVARWPAEADTVRRRTADYDARLASLDAQIRQHLDAIPRTRRRVVAAHDAFGYFGDAYGVDFLAARGWNPHAEPSAAAIARLVRQVREQQAHALFLENIADPRLIERIARESGARVGGTLYADALSAPGGPADSYLRLMAHNVRTLADALGPETPR